MTAYGTAHMTACLTAGLTAGAPADLAALRGGSSAGAAAYAARVRAVSRRLVAQDNEPGAPPVAPLAVRAFADVRRVLRQGGATRATRDVLAAAAELAEIAGWALFSAGRFAAARRANREALRLARLAGDRPIELLVYQNMGLLAGWTGRSGEELALARTVLDGRRLPPRVEALFRAREAQGLAGTGRAWEARRSFARARGLLEESAPASTPGWAWWITPEEIDRQEGGVLHRAGEWREAIPVLRRATADTDVRVGYHSVAAVRLLASLVEVRSWREAERVAAALPPAVAQTTSRVTLGLLADVARRGLRQCRAPGALREALHGVLRAADARAAAGYAALGSP